uniref:NADH:ubiquinone reductase (H(+)-translocating) n=1 Tax=Cephalochlamys namaquensis TaxID=406060 RepID=A0A8F7CDA3_9CEST|nr:NADH dehydrogenase subunit 5 [Cephalochlamys namaquensis]
MLFFTLIALLLCLCCVCSLHQTFNVSLISCLYNTIYWNNLISVDTVTLFILLMLAICFIYVLSYTHHYFGDYSVSCALNFIICLFVGVMATLVCTGDFLTTLIFWEYLGVVSYFLIIFYMSYLSLRSSIITLVSSRFGDVCLFILIGLSCLFSNYTLCYVILFFFIIITKSAGFPFISWLLEAMRAPTPVSSLVHSSTLVAAGVWFSMRYDIYLYISSPILFVVCLLLTIFITGVSCFFFFDLKKIVALSTCNNISWCVLYLLMGDVVLSLFQLVSHGVSKCLLFMLVGDIMSGASGSQAANCVYSPLLYGRGGVFSLICSILGLSGVPFLGCFYTKHLLLTEFNGMFNVLLNSFVLICIFLSYFYSFRLCSLILNLNVSNQSGVLFFCSSGCLVFLWLLLNYFTGSLLNEVSLVNVNTSLFLIIFQLSSLFIAYFIYSSVLLNFWSSSLFGCDSLVESSYNAYINLCNILGGFFYRWDSYCLSLFSGIGVNSVLNFNLGVLNCTFLSIAIFMAYIFLLNFCV